MKKQLVILGLLATVLTGIVGFDGAAEAATRGQVGSSTSIIVTLKSDKFKNGRVSNPATKYATARLNLIDPGSQVKATIYDADTGRVLTTWIAKDGDVLQFGNDHKRYKLTFAKYKQHAWVNNTWYFSSPVGCTYK